MATVPEIADIGRYPFQHGVDVAIHVKAANTEIPFVILHFLNVCE